MNSKGLKLMVKWVLENEMEARNDDNLLVALVDAQTNEKVLRTSYVEVMKNREEYGLYPVESITRARREVQEDNIELRGVDWVTRRRLRKEKEVRAYYRERKNGEK